MLSCSSLTLANPCSLLSTFMFLLLSNEDHQDCLQEPIYPTSDYTIEENTLPPSIAKFKTEGLAGSQEPLLPL